MCEVYQKKVPIGRGDEMIKCNDCPNFDLDNDEEVPPYREADAGWCAVLDREVKPMKECEADDKQKTEYERGLK